MVVVFDSSIGRVCDSCSGDCGFDPRSERRLPTGWVDVSVQKSWSPHSVSVLQYIKLSDISPGTHPRGSLVADKDRKKLNK